MLATSFWESPFGERLQGKGRHWCNCR